MESGSFDIDADARETRGELLENVLPFWLDHGMDREYGGLVTGLDRRGCSSRKECRRTGRRAVLLFR